jgi:membrane protease YdiL (CAAX protease family)
MPQDCPGLKADATNRKIVLLWPFLLGFFLLWTLWALLLKLYPGLTQGGLLRAGVRVLVWILPSCLFVWKIEGISPIDGLALRTHKMNGLSWGLSGFALLFLVSSIRYGSRVFNLTLPHDADTWLNPILTAPIAEEILFRGVVLRVLLTRFNTTWALTISSALFVLIHVPYWLMAGGHSFTNLLALLLSIFVLGLWFGFLFCRSRSLWASLICHTLNNLFSISAGI